MWHLLAKFVKKYVQHIWWSKVCPNIKNLFKNRKFVQKMKNFSTNQKIVQKYGKFVHFL